MVVLADEIYEKILYSGEHINMASLTGSDVLCFTFSGLSKAYRACGWRAGWLVSTGPLDDASDLFEGLQLLANMRMCANVPAQHAIQTALGGYQSIDDMVKRGRTLPRPAAGRPQAAQRYSRDQCEPARGALYLFPHLNAEMFDIEDTRNGRWVYCAARRS